MDEAASLRDATLALARRIDALERRHLELAEALERAEARISTLEAQLAGVPEALRASGTLTQRTGHLQRLPRSAALGADLASEPETGDERTERS